MNALKPKSTFRLVATFTLSLIVSLTHRAIAQDLPDYMDVIVGSGAPSTKTQVAEQNVLALDIAMFGLYDDAQMKFQKNFLAQRPVIMALFSNQGGRLILFRPGKAPLEAPQVPIRYQLYKSQGIRPWRFSSLSGLIWVRFPTIPGRPRCAPSALQIRPR